VQRDARDAGDPQDPAAGVSGLLVEDRLKLLLPGSLYFAYKIAKEARRAEPELRALRTMVRRGCTAIDVGANRGFYSYALSWIARRVEAFEPNPAVAAFARAKLGKRVRLHEVALSDREGTATFHLPRTADGRGLHLLGSLGNFHRIYDSERIQVRLATLDSFGFEDVGFIKIDVEGSEPDVIAGARRTIARDRPNLLVELLTRPTDEALIAIEKIEDEFGYTSTIMHEGRRRPALEFLRQSRGAIGTNNVLFSPR
jgi:FkbM family methyltransferase